MDLSLSASASDTSVDSTSSVEGNVLELLVSKYKRALDWKDGQIKDLKAQIVESKGAAQEELNKEKQSRANEATELRR